MTTRLLLANLLDKVGATEALFGYRRASGTAWLPVVTFHRIHEVPGDGSYMFDEGVVDATPDEFERQLQTISRYLTPVRIQEVAAAIAGGPPLPPRPVLVTFDDGYRDNYDIALPILRRYGVKATFFIATHYLSRRRVFWWDRINYIVKASRRRELRLSYPFALEASLATPRARAVAIQCVLRVVKTHCGLDLERFLVELAVAADVAWTDELDRELAEASLMTWDQVRELAAAGMDVQSHTRTHRVLQTVDARQLREELRGSRDDLEANLNAPISFISFPVGYRLAERDDVRRELALAGYKLGFTNDTGTHRLRRSGDRYDISRFGLDRGIPEALFRAHLAAPELFG